MLAKLLVFIFIILPVFCFGAVNSVKVESDRLSYSGKSKDSIFEGNVVAYYQDLVIHADKMTVTFTEKKDVEKILCDGNVKIVKGDMYSLSEFAEFKVKENVAILRKNVKVWQGENYLEGDEVILYNDDEKIVVNKSDTSRVKIIFNPEGEQIDIKSQKP